MDNITYGNQEIKITDRNSVTISGITKLVSFDDEEFLMETNMGNLQLLGESLELLNLDTANGNLKVKGNINALTYMDSKRNKKGNSLLTKLFK